MRASPSRHPLFFEAICSLFVVWSLLDECFRHFVVVLLSGSRGGSCWELRNCFLIIVAFVFGCVRVCVSDPLCPRPRVRVLFVFLILSSCLLNFSCLFTRCTLHFLHAVLTFCQVLHAIHLTLYGIYPSILGACKVTVMSEACAERCGLTSRIDTRFAGRAVGVGFARILGRIHDASIR